MKGFLVLEDKTVFQGQWHGTNILNAVGEVVFNTSMTGYQEIITDPSYYGQIIVMTAPEQGNYGVTIAERESKKVHCEGFVCLQFNENFTAGRKGLDEELLEFGRPALSGIDTRALTLHLRSHGTPWGAMVQATNKNEAQKVGLKLIEDKKQSSLKDWVFEVTTPETVIYKGSHLKGRVAVIDYGTKKNIIEELQKRFSEVAVFNSRATHREILHWAPSAVMLTNGPGDPGLVEKSVSELKSLLGQVPVFGICMGHQILALAVGAKTYKLKFGHRGANHPVRNLNTGEIYMTSQNHGYAVGEDLPEGVKLSQINLYDKTVEGIEIPSKKAWSVQYHPEACPGPHDSRVLFDHFASEVIK